MTGRADGEFQRFRRIDSEQQVHVGRRGAVTAQQPVFAQYPQVAALRRRRVRRFGDLVRVGQPLLHAGIEQLGKLVRVETEQ